MTNIFTSHLHSKLVATPFSPAPLSEESTLILPQLERLNARTWWTVGSQPAIDSASSADKVVGWGPRGGFVFQKAFVEFFAEEVDVPRLERAVEQGNGVLTFYAANARGEYRSNADKDARNAVTWGVFPGQEIVQSTILEKASFLAWKVRHLLATGLCGI